MNQATTKSGGEEAISSLYLPRGWFTLLAMTSFFVTLTLNEVKGKGLKEILRYAQNDRE